MAFPDLDPKTWANGVVSNQVCEATGVPINGNNVIGLPWVDQGIDPTLIELDRIDFRVEAQGSSVTGSAEVSIAPDKKSVTLSFVQSGGDAAIVRAWLAHTEIS